MLADAVIARAAFRVCAAPCGASAGGSVIPHLADGPFRAIRIDLAGSSHTLSGARGRGAALQLTLLRSAALAVRMTPRHASPRAVAGGRAADGPVWTIGIRLAGDGVKGLRDGRAGPLIAGIVG